MTTPNVSYQDIISIGFVDKDDGRPSQATMRPQIPLDHIIRTKDMNQLLLTVVKNQTYSVRNIYSHTHRID